MVVDHALAQSMVVGTDDQPIMLGQLWRDRPALLLWVRHFG